MSAITNGLHGSLDISELLNKGSLGTDAINNAKARVLDVLSEGREIKFGGHAVKIVPSSLEARLYYWQLLRLPVSRLQRVVLLIGLLLLALS